MNTITGITEQTNWGNNWDFNGSLGYDNCQLDAYVNSSFKLKFNAPTINDFFDFSEYGIKESRRYPGDITELDIYKEEVREREMAWRIKKAKQFPRLNLNFKLY